MHDGAYPITVAGQREGIVLTVVLTPPDHCRVEEIAQGPASDGVDIQV